MTNQPKTTNPAPISDMLEQLWVDAAHRGAFELNPDVVTGWVEMALGALDVLVTAKRGKYKHDPALKQTIEEHLEHARDHAWSSLEAYVDDDGGNGIFDDDGLHHYHHATARVALALTRKAIVEHKKAARPKVTFEVDSADAFAALDRIQSAAYAATKLRLQREGLADANGNAIPCVPKAEKKPVVVIGMDGGDCYRATAPVERKCDNNCVPNGTVLIGGTRYRPTHGFAKVGTGTGYWDGVACGVTGCDAASPLKTVTCKSDECVTITSREQCAQLLGASHPLVSSRMWNDSSFWKDIDRHTGTISVKSHETTGDDGGTFVPTEPSTLNGKPFAPAIHQTRIGTAVDSVKAGEVVAVESLVGPGMSGTVKGNKRFVIEYTTNWQPMPGDLSRVTFCGVPFPDVRFDCKGCAFEKWTGGPGYSERCDKCRTHGLTRPSYEVKR